MIAENNSTEVVCWENTGGSYLMEQVCSISRKNIVKIVFAQRGRLMMEKQYVSKQDCELNAAKHLLEKIKKDYPRLPICIQGDALYEVEPLMKLCKKNYHWEYLFAQKDTR